MAGLKATNKMPVGSMEWLDEEKTLASQMVEEESEDFAFCARNEAEWLNEHIADIFSENHLSVKDIFKTPGKLQGKTPRTVRKRNPLEARAPLTDLFSTTPRVQASQVPVQYDRLKTPKFQVAKDVDPSPEVQSPKQKNAAVANKYFNDSGYHGSQSHVEKEPMEVDETAQLPQSSPPKTQIPQAEVSDAMELDAESDEPKYLEDSFQSANENQLSSVEEEAIKSPSPLQNTEDAPEHSQKTLDAAPCALRSPERSVIPMELAQLSSPKPKALPLEIPQEEIPHEEIPHEQTQQEDMPQEISQEEVLQEDVPQEEMPQAQRPVSREADVTFDDAQSPSDGSSPIRPIVRKSSLSFASLPAREPITTKQSIGNRVSGTSHLDQTRQSYFGRPTGGKSLGNGPQINNSQQEPKKDDANRMELDEEVAAQKPELTREESDSESNILQLHNKTSTQRLQDQISKLGQSQSNVHRPSKSIPNVAAASASQLTYPTLSQHLQEEVPSARKARPTVLPGTFPEDEDDSWIGPPHTSMPDTSVRNDRPGLTKGHPADAMEGVHGTINGGRSDFMVSKQRENETALDSPIRETTVPDHTTGAFGHAKCASASHIKSPKQDTEEIAESPHKKGISVSNPSLAPGQDSADQSTAPPASPTRSYRDSPLKASKDKLSSILKFSKGLFASGAALSAEAKSSGFSPASKRTANQPSIPDQNENLLTQTATDQNLYPTLETVVDDAEPASPSRLGTGRKTRASTEREEKRKEKEAKEAQRMLAQLDKLEKAREKEKQKARVFSQEKEKEKAAAAEKLAAAEKQAIAEKEAAAQLEQEKQAKASHFEVPRATRTSPRKTKAQLEAEGRAAAALPVSDNDEEMGDAPTSMPPPAIPRTMMASQIGKPSMPKRPGRPLKEPVSKTKQAPMIIRVDTGSQRNQTHPSNSALAASLQASLAPSSSASSHTALKSKASTATVAAKASTNSFSSSVSSTGAPRPRALESAARKREQDEREAQRKRDIKLENERKLEEKRQEQQRKRALEREREQQEAKKSAQAARQAMLKRKEVEMAKQQRPPPPPARPQPMEDNGRSGSYDKPLPTVPQRMNQAPPRPGSKMENARSQEDLGRPMNMGFQNTTKAPPKRPFQQDGGEEQGSRPTMQRSGPSYQQNEGKRRKTGDDCQDPDMPETQSRQMAPPIRQSTMRQKDGPTKALFPNGYSNAQQGSHAGSSLHKATLQHLHQSKPVHPMDMAQVSKANISFAASGTQPVAGSSSYKTPARPAGANAAGKSAAKSHAKSSPRYQNGDDINLPEIHTDSEDEDEDGETDFAVPDWADSPALRDQLAAQDSIDPSDVFGPMPELKMEEIFKNKERWNRFRARTSSANWSGSDRLTDDEIRRDLEGRERLRREGGWTYGLS